MAVKCGRIKKSIDFERIFQTGKTITGRFVFLKIKKTKNKKCRLCFVAGSKVSKKAVERNKIKRRLREVLRGVYSDLAPEYDIVIIAKKEISGKKYKEIKEDTIKALKGAKILN
jgi:ribonuclease P protein component